MLKSTIRCVLLGSLVLAATAQAKEYWGVNIPDSLDHDGQKLMLNGAGLRSKFFVKAYVGALYTVEPSNNATSHIDASTLRVIQLHFKLDVAADKIRGAWMEGFENNCKPKCAELKPSLTELNDLMDDQKEGQVLGFVLEGDKVSVTKDGQVKGTIEKPGFPQAVMSIFVGKNPADSDLKAGLLGN